MHWKTCTEIVFVLKIFVIQAAEIAAFLGIIEVN